MNEYSRYSHIVLLRNKSDAYLGFLELIEDGFNTISTIRSDKGSENLCKTFQVFCKSNGIRQELSSVHIPEEMGIAKRLNMFLLEKVKPMLMQSALPSTC